MKKTVLLVLVSLCFIVSFSAAAEEVTIDFWHAMGGHNLEVVNTLVEEFNSSQDQVEVKAQYTGSYNDTLTKTQSAVQTGTAPHIIQIYEIGTQMMLDSGIIMPIEDLGKEVAGDNSFDWDKFLVPVSNYYTIDGKLNSMPFNSSTPILYYDRDAFEEAGLDPNRPPQTFAELKEYARKLTIKNDDGTVERYGFTQGIVGWFVEQMVANQDATLVNNDNGRSARATASNLNEEAAVRFVKLWKEMVDEGIMLNPGRGWDGANQAFSSGRAAMLIESTSSVAGFTENAEAAGFELGTGFLPRPAAANRGGVIIGGASLWTIADHPEEELKATWEFLKWLSEEEQQVYWFENTGYFPVTKAAVEREMNNKFFAENPNYLTAFLQLLLSKKAVSTQGALIGTFPEVRQIVEESVEKTLEGNMTPQAAMDEAAERVNKSLKEYNQLNE
ncbi:MAG: sn-glycerol 3-phosphate transport system substrate-binding protein [Halanaerobium sp. 4-GBenrich]|jgi:sn-glycerol 3-phosphate transport system substrate-binding protein|uniref:Carbohydrate ABC transporter substrate-binding protein, CUT1 family n=1 Tax=Halanaerobium congolense TaxID=54121 RepID=A0A1G8JEC7_9FIRM|nr:ABC transporter substrate-binding protein [Halanaerobium congolense]ODS50708.1 MAG: sn-glycerol 3-phosphate transport system substrate-binding protein [Halanaerobium sp. 4-GBenrich]PUU91338.1 MAG: sn-glycerol 3-phosphate transport system substrate-binding protein [Halanaerobium sp.]SDI29555.1 carbohydrate ABC transporter substrate-binding protein, CUT1 family [Halanaerobium congolense]SES82347.1 carbohydrate ABC transporter substrate-binding protein, CUT1 family [Halanaerobium congolense]